MNISEIKKLCAKFPELEINPDFRMNHYNCYVKNVNATDDVHDRVVLFGYDVEDQTVKYSKFVSLNVSQFDEYDTEITFPDPYDKIYDVKELEKKIKITLESIRLLEETKKKIKSKMKQLELEKDFEK